MSPAELKSIQALVRSDEIITPEDAEYTAASSTWSIHKNKHPALIVRPKSLESLSKVLKALSTTDLEIDIRSSGFGSASAKDVLISLSAFNEFEFDRKNEVVTLGTGQSWTRPRRTTQSCRLARLVSR